MDQMSSPLEWHTSVRGATDVGKQKIMLNLVLILCVYPHGNNKLISATLFGYFVSRQRNAITRPECEPHTINSSIIVQFWILVFYSGYSHRDGTWVMNEFEAILGSLNHLKECEYLASHRTTICHFHSFHFHNQQPSTELFIPLISGIDSNFFKSNTIFHDLIKTFRMYFMYAMKITTQFSSPPSLIWLFWLSNLRKLN